MIEVSALLFTLLAEGTGLLSIILIIWIVVSVRKKGKDKAAATKLVSNIKKQADVRLDSINSFLSTSTSQEPEEIQLSAKKIDRLEKDFFTQLIRLYIKRDGDILSTMDEQLDKVTTAYKDAVSDSNSASNQDSEEIINKVETLEKENLALVDELKITKVTMGNMMSEFNTMFNGGNETAQTSKEALQSSVAQVEEQNQNEADSLDDDIAIKESSDNDIAIEDIDDEIFFAGASNNDAIEPKPKSDSEDDFGSIVTSDDVDDILEGIDLSKEIDIP